MFNPCRFCSCKPFVRLHRAESLIVLYSRNVEYCVFKVLRQFRIDETSISREHWFSQIPHLGGDIHRQDYDLASAGVVALKQLVEVSKNGFSEG